MPARLADDAQPPSGWPSGVVYLNKPRLDPAFPTRLVPFLYSETTVAPAKYNPRPTAHPPYVQIKTITAKGHPAFGQHGLFAKTKLDGGKFVIPYIGIIHHTLIPAEGNSAPVTDGHSESDYDLSLFRLSASVYRNPFPGSHISIGIDAAVAGNAGRFVNDYRGVAEKPNAEFRLGQGATGELRMEVWALKQGLSKGDEVLVSYGKGWWGARRA